MKTLNYLSFIFVLALLIACNGQKSEENTDPVKKEEVKKDHFSGLNEIKLPIHLERPNMDNANKLINKLGLEVNYPYNSNRKKIYFKTVDNIPVEIYCFVFKDAIRLEFTVLDMDCKMVGEPLELIYAGGNSWLAASIIKVENNLITYNTEVETTVSTNLADPNNTDYKTEKTTENKVYKITDKGIIELNK